MSLDSHRPDPPEKGITYAEAGVDIGAANTTKQRIKSLLRSTFGPEVLSDVGAFAGLFQAKWGDYEDPVLVSSVDGVGTKLKVAFMMGKHDTVGIDLVSHCVNDILVYGAQPLFFMDYIAMTRHSGEVILEVVSGIARACKDVGCTLLGGEMAEMPGFYNEGEYDLIGMVVGLVDRKGIIDGSRISPGDVILGLASNGLHTNGYSLARKLFFDHAGWDVNTYIDPLGCTIGEELMKPHRCYARPVLELLRSLPVHGIVHITGGGFQDNIPRILPPDRRAHIRLGSWDIPPVFTLLQKTGKISDEEMFHTFNMGIGMLLILPPENTERAEKLLIEHGEKVFGIGEISEGTREVSFDQK